MDFSIESSTKGLHMNETQLYQGSVQPLSRTSFVDVFRAHVGPRRMKHPGGCNRGIVTQHSRTASEPALYAVA